MTKYFLLGGGICLALNVTAQYFSTNDMQRIPFMRNAGTDKLSDLHYADFNKDGLMDVLTDGGLTTNQSGYIENTSKPVFFINDGNGKLVPTNTPFTHASNSSVISDVADYNNDGYADILVLDFWANGMRLYKGSAGLNFTLAQTLPTGTHGAKGYFEDIDGDGDLDIYNVSTGSASPTAMHIFTNDGGIFTKATYFTANNLREMAPKIWAKDVNHDGRKDIVATIGENTEIDGMGIWLQNPDKTFAVMTFEYLGSNMKFGAFGSLTYGWDDLNADGFEDLIFLNDRDADNSSGANAVYSTAVPPYLGKAADLEGPSINSMDYSGYFGQDMATGDIDRDGRMDIVTCDRVWRQETTPRRLKVLIDPCNRNGSFMLQTIDLGLADIKQDGRGLLLADLDKDNDLELVSLGMDDTLRVFGLKPVTTTGIANPSNAERPKFTVYPNPAQQVLYIRLTDPAKKVSAAAIYSTDGKLIQKLTKKQLQSDIEISQLAAGNYYITLYNDKGQYYTQKFVKAK